MSHSPIPLDIKLHKLSKTLELVYSDSEQYELSCEYLRVYSPSAEVKGHGPGQEVLQVGKINTGITKIQAVGNYAVQLFFTDEHDSGIYSWDYLYELCTKQASYWENYLTRLDEAGAVRDPDIQIIKLGD